MYLNMCGIHCRTAEIIDLSWWVVPKPLSSKFSFISFFALIRYFVCLFFGCWFISLLHITMWRRSLLVTWLMHSNQTQEINLHTAKTLKFLVCLKLQLELLYKQCTSSLVFTSFWSAGFHLGLFGSFWFNSHCSRGRYFTKLHRNPKETMHHCLY